MVKVPTVPVNINITPETLNTKSQGRWITCKIKAPAGYTVADIDKDSIKLAGSIQADRVQLNPGQQQVMVKFDRQAAIEAIAAQEGVDLNGGFAIFADVTITGQLTDGTKFEGTDKIRFLHNTR